MATSVTIPITDFATVARNTPDVARKGFDEISLLSTNVSPMLIGLLKLDLSALPDDIVIDSATLRIRVSDKTATSPETIDDVKLATSWALNQTGDWSEDTVTYNIMKSTFDFAGYQEYTSPEQAKVAMDVTGHLNGLITHNSNTLRVEVNQSKVDNGTSTIGIYGNDNPTYKPELVLTYSSIPPRVPTNLVPTGVVKIASEEITFRWKFNSDIVGDTQTAYQIQYSTDGVAYTDVVENTSLQYHIFPANTFTGDRVFWRVRTKNANNIWGEYSVQVVFLTAAKPATPNITSGVTTNVAYPTITWASVDQYLFQIQILEGTTVYYDTGEVISTDKSFEIEKALENSKTYTVKLRIKNKYNIFSDFDSQSLATNFQVPQKPLLFKIQESDRNFDNPLKSTSGKIKLKITNPADTLNFFKNEIYRREINGNWEKIGDNIIQNGEFEDVTYKYATWYEYKVRTFADTQGFTDSDIIKSKNVFIGNLLYSMDSKRHINILKDTSVSVKQNRQRALRQFAGRTRPVAELGEHQYKTIGISLVVRIENVNDYLNFINSETIFCFRNAVDKIFCELSDDPSYSKQDENFYNISFTLTETDFKEVI